MNETSLPAPDPQPTRATSARDLAAQPRRTAPIELDSVLTCPGCGHAKRETMPTDCCQFFYECEHCRVLLSPKSGDCCVFCSYGSVKCPPVQEERGCCQSAT